MLSVLRRTAVRVTRTDSRLHRCYSHLSLSPGQLFRLRRHVSGRVSLTHGRRIDPRTLPRCCRSLLRRRRRLSSRTSSRRALTLTMAGRRRRTLRVTHTLRRRHRRCTRRLTRLVASDVRTLSVPRKRFAVSIGFSRRRLNTSNTSHVRFQMAAGPNRPVRPVTGITSNNRLSHVTLTVRIVATHGVRAPTLVFSRISMKVDNPATTIINGLLHRLNRSARIVYIARLPRITKYNRRRCFIDGRASNTVARARVRSLGGGTQLRRLTHLLNNDRIAHGALTGTGRLLTTWAFFLLRNRDGRRGTMEPRDGEFWDSRESVVVNVLRVDRMLLKPRGRSGRCTLWGTSYYDDDAVSISHELFRSKTDNLPS